MNKPNFDRAMQETLSRIPRGTPLLLHSCCGPCSSRCIEELKETFAVTVLYYNPNIFPREEYEKRKAEQLRFLRETGWAQFLDCDYDERGVAERDRAGAGGALRRAVAAQRLQKAERLPALHPPFRRTRAVSAGVLRV